MEDVVQKLMAIARFCESQIQQLATKIGTDEGSNECRATITQPQQAVITMLQKLAAAGYGSQVAEITPANFRTARRAVGLLAKWKSALLTTAGELQKEAEKPQPPAESPQPPVVIDELVTLDQVAPLTGLSKRSLERYLGKGELPDPDIPGGGGRSHKWYWQKLRPDLAKVARRTLPDKFPAGRIV